MSMKYVFDADAHFVRCIGTARGNVSRTLEMLYYPLPPREGLGWRYIGGNAITVLVDAGMSRDVAVHRLKGIHDDIRDNGIRKRQFDRLGQDERIKSTFKPPISTYHLGYAQKTLAKPVSMITENYNHDVVVEQRAVYLGKCLPHCIEHIPFVAPYEAAVVIDWGAPPTTVMRRLRRFIRHVERFGLDDCNTLPYGPRELGYD